MENIFENEIFTASPRLFKLGSGELSLEVTDLGAALVRLSFRGRPAVLGYDEPSLYAKGQSALGATVGRYAGRIGGARFSLDGSEYVLEKNDGENHLHGGFGKKLWRAEQLDNSVRFTLISPAGEEGFPGDVAVSAEYRLEGPVLRLVYRAFSSAPTPINLTNHTYFNLEGAGSVGDHTLTVNAPLYAETDGDLIPTGRFIETAGSALDLSSPRRLSELISEPSLARTRGLDHSFIVPGCGLRFAARLVSIKAGFGMDCFTTRPTVHVYTGGFLDSDPAAVFPQNGGVCLETQHLPDSPNRPEFPSAVLRPGEVFSAVTEYRFFDLEE